MRNEWDTGIYTLSVMTVANNMDNMVKNAMMVA
jgi:hypothetical protein